MVSKTTEEIIAASWRLLAALDKLDEGCIYPGFRGDEVQNARESMAELLRRRDDNEKVEAEYETLMAAAKTCCRKHWEESTNYSPLTFMMLCKTCGNKRCPKATDCSFQCTGSNEPGQVGSRY